jgi:hypothetical protein
MSELGSKLAKKKKVKRMTDLAAKYFQGYNKNICIFKCFQDLDF